MLHDLYLLSCYFEPTQAILYEDDLKKRYGALAVQEAASQGFLEFYCAPCSKGIGRFFCRLSSRGIHHVESLAH